MFLISLSANNPQGNTGFRKNTRGSQGGVVRGFHQKHSKLSHGWGGGMPTKRNGKAAVSIVELECLRLLGHRSSPSAFTTNRARKTGAQSVVPVHPIFAATL